MARTTPHERDVARMKRCLRWLHPSQLAEVEATIKSDPPDAYDCYREWRSEYYGPLPVFTGMLVIICFGFVFSVASSLFGVDAPYGHDRWIIWLAGGVQIFMAITLGIMRQFIGYSAAYYLAMRSHGQG